jgi:hypothetical protein
MESFPDVDLPYFGRGLSSDELKLVLQSVPDTSVLQRRVLGLSPSFIAMRFPPGSKLASIPNAAVCFTDMTDSLSDAQYALGQGLISLAVYRQRVPFELGAVWLASFYLSDLASRLYSAGEHIAAGICDTLGISDSDLNSGKPEKRVSRQSKLARYVTRQLQPDHPLVIAGLVLADHPEWFLISEYRSKSVHSEPPTLAGLGVTYQRGKQRWTTVTRDDGSMAGHQISVGGGDEPLADIDDLLAKATTALKAFVDYATTVVEFYCSQLSQHGIDYDPATGTTRIGNLMPRGSRAET